MFGKRDQRVIVEVETLEGLGIEEEVKLRKYFPRVRSCCSAQFIMAKVLWWWSSSKVGKGTTVRQLLEKVERQRQGSINCPRVTVHSFRSYCVFINLRLSLWRAVSLCLCHTSKVAKELGITETWLLGLQWRDGGHSLKVKIKPSHHD